MGQTTHHLRRATSSSPCFAEFHEASQFLQSFSCSWRTCVNNLKLIQSNSYSGGMLGHQFNTQTYIGRLIEKNENASWFISAPFFFQRGQPLSQPTRDPTPVEEAGTGTAGAGGIRARGGSQVSSEGWQTRRSRPWWVARAGAHPRPVSTGPWRRRKPTTEPKTRHRACSMAGRCKGNRCSRGACSGRRRRSPKGLS